MDEEEIYYPFPIPREKFPDVSEALQGIHRKL